jgi:hypothetical protein
MPFQLWSFRESNREIPQNGKYSRDHSVGKRFARERSIDLNRDWEEDVSNGRDEASNEEKFQTWFQTAVHIGEESVEQHIGIRILHLPWLVCWSCTVSLETLFW